MKKFSDFKEKKRPIVRINENDVIGITQPSIQNDTENQTVVVNNGEQVNNNDKMSPSKLFSKLFETREMAHVYHLQVRGDEGSYAKHMALGAYYDAILLLIDAVIEVYQGQHGIIDGYDIIDTNSTKSKDPVDYFEETANWIKDARKSISAEDTHIHNMIDEIIALMYQTLYKLKFNK